MKLLLVRHAETEHNVKGLLAGSTDSALTNHGVIQTQKLGQYIAKEAYNVRTIFASDLRRARITAEAIRDERVSIAGEHQAKPVDVITLPILREQDFGSYELQPWSSKPTAGDDDKISLTAEKAGYREKESHDSLNSRCNAFLNDHLLPTVDTYIDGDSVIVVVSHGLTLSALWKCLMFRFSPKTISLGPHVMTSAGFRPLEHLPSWSNTGYLELDIVRSTSRSTSPLEHLPELSTGAAEQGLSHRSMTVLKVNCIEHLKNLKRTRGGVGSATYDSNQQRLEGFFAKRPKVQADSGQKRA